VTSASGRKPPVALVTGAGGGIGQAIAQRLAASGATVLATDIKAAPPGLHPTISYIVADLTHPETISGLLASPVLADSLDYLVNAAGVAWWERDGSPLDAYQVSKAAVVSLTRSLAQQLGPEGIRCNTVCPGAILTPMIEPLYADAPERRASMEARTPLRRLGMPEDIASAVAFLLSAEASFITGIDLVVDGGWTIQTV